MPLPTPNKNEKESDFVKRCMPAASKEAKDNKQAIAICMSQFRKKKSQGLLSKTDDEYRANKYSEELDGTSGKTKKDWDKIDRKELKRDTKKEKKEHEKDAIKDDKEKLKKLKKVRSR